MSRESTARDLIGAMIADHAGLVSPDSLGELLRSNLEGALIQLGGKRLLQPWDLSDEGEATARTRSLDSLAASLGDEKLRDAFDRMLLAVRDLSVRDLPHSQDRWDWSRNFGMGSLGASLRDTHYLQHLLQASGPPYNSDSAKEEIERELQSFVPGASYVAFTNTGSDAVSMAFDVARVAGADLHDHQRSELLYFSGCYGGPAGHRDR